ncbi:MAG TPA: hypothetical protein DCG57_09785 [Candidatus Riflebacteria bacterium]|jgi:tetratricopeptide (TPR) repeat protein|nr:hypothetical protein [Candidatus Riflebacteria bacterium]
MFVEAFMNNRRYFILILLVVAVLQPVNVFATRSSSVQLQCPVCDNSLTAMQLMSTNNFGGVDTDFMQRPMGSSPILIRPATCLKCGFSGYIDDFSSEAKAKMPATFTSAISQEKALKPAVDLASYTDQIDMPAWAKYDLIAQVRKLENSPVGDIAHQYLSAAWAVRSEAFVKLSDSDFQRMNEFMKATFSERLKERDTNPSVQSVNIARDALKMSEKAENNEARDALTAAVFLFRLYGENPDALKAMQRLSPMLASETDSVIEEDLKKGIDLEQHFQKLAIENFKLAITTETDEELKARFCYLLGETYRRLGDFKEARTWFEQVRAIKGRPAFLEEMIVEVEKRMTAAE